MGRKSYWLGYESIQFLGLFVFVGLQEHKRYLIKNKNKKKIDSHDLAITAGRTQQKVGEGDKKQHLSQEHWPCQLASKWLHILCFISIILRIRAEMSFPLLRELTMWLV